jgi:hypothetical protein
MSGDIQVAETLFRDVQGRLGVGDQGFLFYAKVKQRITKHLEEITYLKASEDLDRWYQTKQDVYLEAIEAQLAAAETEGLINDATRNIIAIVDFYRSRTTKGARKIYERIPKKNRDAIWHLNMAFLSAYDHDLRAATRHYRKASQAGIPHANNDVTVGQIEHFLLWQLDKEPNLIEMHFCLGFVNMHLKGDVERARMDFEEFLAVCPAEKYNDEKFLIRKWIAEMDRSG